MSTKNEMTRFKTANSSAERLLQHPFLSFFLAEDPQLSPSQASIFYGYKKDAFCTMVESTKQVSENYLSTEKGYADDWAAYIASCHMTAEEALDYIRTTNTQEDRAAHLVDMADLSARSTFVRNGNPWVHCYEEQQKLATTDSSAFLDKMEQLFNASPGEVPVLGKYRVGESQRTVVSVGTRVMIREEDGSDRPYLLLRLIPVEYLQNTWAFPTEFPLAEISMIVNLSINQNLRRAVDMAEHANQAKTQFLSTMSHDIRTPMNAVISMTEIAKLHLDDAGYVKDAWTRSPRRAVTC